MEDEEKTLGGTMKSCDSDIEGNCYYSEFVQSHAKPIQSGRKEIH